jgi:hypothetical protein
MTRLDAGAGASTPDSPSPADHSTGVGYAFILGRGRSGTNWIGQVLNQYRKCLYKHEPFGRYKKASAFRDWFAKLGSDDPAQLRARFFQLCAGCFHDIDYPPFLRKTCRRQSPLLLRITWQIGKIWPAARGLYEWYGRPSFHRGDWVLVKQVNFPNEKLEQFVEVLSPPIVAILRNPYSSVSSSFRFCAQESRAVRTPGDVDRVVELMPTMEEFDVRYTRAELEAMPLAAFEAVRWRVQSEPLAAFIDRYERGLKVLYETFANDPEDTTRAIFQFFGWEYHEEITRFLERTTRGARTGLVRWRDPRYTIHRDPQQEIQRWKKDLSAEDVAAINRVIRGSRLLELWPKL